MDKLTFNIHIDAPSAHVWKCLWEDEGYKNWTSVFYPGSYAEIEWKEGGEARFLSPEGDGMWSLVKTYLPGREVVFEHQGEIKKGKKERTSWAGSNEAYLVKEENGSTDLHVTLDTTAESREYFEKTFPAALNRLKEFAENSK